MNQSSKDESIPNSDKEFSTPVSDTTDTGLEHKCCNCNNPVDPNRSYELTYGSPPGFTLCSNNCLFDFIITEMLVGEEKSVLVILQRIIQVGHISRDELNNTNLEDLNDLASLFDLKLPNQIGLTIQK